MTADVYFVWGSALPRVDFGTQVPRSEVAASGGGRSRVVWLAFCRASFSLHGGVAVLALDPKDVSNTSLAKAEAPRQCSYSGTALHRYIHWV